MLEGLEISEVSFTNTLKNKDFRIDSQFYTQEPIKNPKLTYDKIGNCLLNAQYGISIAMNEESIGYPIYRMNEIHSMMCDLEVDKCADISTTDLETFELEDRDVLFNRTNSFQWVGRTGIYKKIDDRKFVFASYLVRFIPDQNKILPEYLATFLNTHAGVADIKRRARQSINQTNVNPEEVKAIDIPILSITFQELLKDCFDQAQKLRIESKSTYQQAEQLLLQEIGLEDFPPRNSPPLEGCLKGGVVNSPPLEGWIPSKMEDGVVNSPPEEVWSQTGVGFNVKSFQESFGTSGRLDAEYYQVKYEEMVTEITRQNHDKLFNLVEISKSIEPGSANYEEHGLPFIRVSDYSEFGITKPDKYLSDSFILQNKELIKSLKPKKGTILFSKDGSVGTAYHLREDKDFITSGAILHLKVKDESKIISEYLTLVLNSKVVKMQAERDAGGSIILHWRVSEIENIVIPIISTNKQIEISELIKQSFSLKKKSEHLLEVAKQAVEMAIEKSEEVAMKWIKKEMK